jgi:MoaA/NifB/PqqE/SkfB family radical SAM enzyme
VIDHTEWTQDAKPLVFLDFKLGNICNLKCRICGSWSSSTFATEELQFLSQDQKKKSIHYAMLKKGAWPRENVKFWQEVDSIIDQIRYVEFTGGEPFMINEHFQLLQSMVDRGIAGNVEVHYNTNGTHWPQHAEEIWKHFKTVEVAFSIDDLGPRFEYQRTNANWDQVQQNLEHFKNLRARNSNIQLQVCSTVNVFNVLYLEELSHWIEQQCFDFVYWNMMHEAYYFSISTLPDMAKMAIKQKLDAACVSPDTKQEFGRIVEFMMRGASLDGNILRMKIRDFDWKRQQNLHDVAPELAKILNYDCDTSNG